VPWLLYELLYAIEEMDGLTIVALPVQCNRHGRCDICIHCTRAVGPFPGRFDADWLCCWAGVKSGGGQGRQPQLSKGRAMPAVTY
jgi:hypothetical protein